MSAISIYGPERSHERWTSRLRHGRWMRCSTPARNWRYLRGGVPDDEFKSYTRAVGTILTSIQLDLMTVITREHPDLDPDR